METTANKTKRLGIEQRQARVAWLSLIPLLLILLLLKIIPMGVAITKSFTNWDGALRSDFVGLRNYAYLLESNELFTMIGNNVFLLLHIPIQLLFGFMLAMYIYDGKPGYKLVRIMYYLPHVVSIVIIGSLFRTFFRESGPINVIITALGLTKQNWLISRWSANTVILLAMVYQSLGWQMLILSGGLSSMDPQVIEASKIDGAGYWQRLFRVIIPMQIRSIEYSIVVSIIWVFSGLYSFIYSITGGGPGYDTTTMDYMVYLKAFKSKGQLGIACACSVLLLIIVLIMVYVQRKVTDKVSEWQ